MSTVSIATTSEAAKIMGVTSTRIHKLISEDRIPGAKKIGTGRGIWTVPVVDGHIEITGSRRRFDKL